MVPRGRVEVGASESGAHTSGSFQRHIFNNNKRPDRDDGHLWRRRNGDTERPRSMMTVREVL